MSKGLFTLNAYHDTAITDQVRSDIMDHVIAIGKILGSSDLTTVTWKGLVPASSGSDQVEIVTMPSVDLPSP